MKTLKLLHCADIHIGAAESFLKEGAENRRLETLLTFERIIDLGIEKGAEIIAIAGDLFDSNKAESRFIEAAFNKIASAAPIKVIFAAGNHDPLNSESPFLNRSLPENLYVLGTKDTEITFEDLGVRVYGRSFESAFLKGEEKFTLTPDQGFINLLVQHGELKSDLNSDYNAITPKFVKESGMDYIALGHVHKKTDIGRIDNTFFAYSGCPEGQGFDELDEKGVYFGEIGKGVCGLEFIPVSKRRHIHIKIDITACEADLPDYITSRLALDYGEDYAENLYKIELTGAVSQDTEIPLPELEKRLEERLYFVKLKDSTEILLDLEALAKETSLKGIFVKKMLERIARADEAEKPILQKAMNLGLKAFTAEVKYSED